MENNKIKDAKERAKKLSVLLAEIKALQQTYDAKPNSVKGKMIASCAMAVEYRHTAEPVLWVACLRSDVSEVENFVSKCKQQVEEEEGKTLLSITDEHGEVFNAKVISPAKGWYIDKNGTDTVFVPFSKSIEVNGVKRMATTIEEAMSIGRAIIRLDEEAFVAFEKSHPELNP